jgi:hypothetical protein
MALYTTRQAKYCYSQPTTESATALRTLDLSPVVCPRAGVRTYLANYCIDDEASQCMETI